jgi:hypothetical protein
VRQPLAGLRVATTMPPHFWTGGLDYNFASEMSDELRAMGAAVFELDMSAFVGHNELYIHDAIAALREFRPDIAFPLPNAGYGLLCVTPDGQNIFRDVLQIPTVMLWDHGLLQFPKLILDPLPQTPGDAANGAIQRMRAMLDHPLYLHYSPDRGHIAALDQLGVIDRRKVRSFLQPAYPNFVRYGGRTHDSNAFRTRLAFAGNVYLQAAGNLPFRSLPPLAEIEARVLRAKKEQLTASLWDLLWTDVQALPRSTRTAMRLDPDSTFFWRFIHDEIEVVGNTEGRLAILTGLKEECEFFGNLIETGSGTALRSRYRMKFRKTLDYFTELPLLFRNSSVIVDVINLGYNTGIAPKVMGCLACGGLVLFDYKDDFHQAMGEVGDRVMYRSFDHLNALVDEYLSDDRKRRDVSRYLQHRASTEFSFRTLCERIFAECRQTRQ